MKYSKPEIEIIKINTLDVIATSGNGDYTQEENQTPLAPPPPKTAATGYWGN